MDGEAVGDRQQLLVEGPQPLDRHRGLDLRAGRAVELVLAGGVLDVLRRLDGPLELLVQVGEESPHLLLLSVDVLLADHALLDQLLGEQLAHAGVAADLAVHRGLRVGGLVGFVVAVAAVADQVDQDVVTELLAEREREAHGGDAGLDVVGVDVDDRDVVALREVRRPLRRAALVDVGGEPDLVVLDQVDGTAHAIAVERLEIERLGDDALAGEGGVAVQDDRDRRVGVAVGMRPLARGLGRAACALDDRGDVL